MPSNFRLQNLARRRERHSLSAAVENRSAKLVLEFCDLPADRGWGDVKSL